ncbi:MULTISPECIES: DUF6269 family protein [unclassified Streptomyces]|uniref:DUF6269 family protein n=1 Tax=unclassified Streptomyces TaxID=2593676 RepID=UPI0023618994|nr:DUF6269 family protein [Streptomyces sp. MMBL 11-1]
MNETPVPHPLDVLDEIDQRHVREQQAMLCARATPWSELLTQYVDALAALVTEDAEPDNPAETSSSDDGHSGS